LRARAAAAASAALPAPAASVTAASEVSSTSSSLAAMQRSTDRIYTTHVGSLARPAVLLDLMRAAAAGQPVDEAERAEAERLAVADVVARAEGARRATARLWS
jgi:hypothetical protein